MSHTKRVSYEAKAHANILKGRQENSDMTKTKEYLIEHNKERAGRRKRNKIIRRKKLTERIHYIKEANPTLHLIKNYYETRIAS